MMKHSQRPLLWCSIHWPLLALDAYGLSSCAEPAAISAQHGQKKAHITVMNDTAQQHGLTQGMPITLAQALCPNLIIKPWNALHIQHYLEQQHIWLYGITPHIKHLRDHDVAIELSGSLKLWNGKEGLLHILTNALTGLNCPYQLAFAPSAGAAQILARAQPTGGPFYPLEAIHPLPAQALLMDTAVFQRAGFTTIGEILKLPTISRTIRLNKDDVQYLETLLYTHRDWHHPVEPITAAQEFEPEVDTIKPILQWLEQCIPTIGTTLQRQQQGVEELTISLIDRQHRLSTHPIAFSTPTADSHTLRRVIFAHLEQVQCNEPIQRALIAVSHMRSIAVHRATLFDDPSPHTCQSPEELTDLLRARLGEQHVQSLQPRADFRPECTLQAPTTTNQLSTRTYSHLPKPTWLHHPPQTLQSKHGQPYQRGPLKLIHGPERIQSGWWDQQAIARDYYIAQHPLGSWMWVYQERETQQWYLHGYFA